MKKFICFAMSVLTAASISVQAKEEAQVNPYAASLSLVKPLDLPIQCARLVSQGEKSAQNTRAVQLVEAAVATHPTSTPAVVGAIARAVPELAAVAAARGCALQPKMTAAIVKAAASAAPNEAGRIVYSVCRALPYQYQTVANAASAAVPALGSEILGAITLAVPEMKPYVLEAAARARGDAATVPNVLASAATSAGTTRVARLAESAVVASAMPVMPPPRVGLPFVPLSGTPGEITPDSSGEVPEGGRDYATP
ncbi:MAG: hypothetical protein JXQ71_08670 [Verrucomicrobia bacterium]|nr:hypothetical protein [Verrucomicrobiota bacterium]